MIKRTVIRYFSLGLLGEIQLGKDEKEHDGIRKDVLLILLMYLGVMIGVFADWYLNQIHAIGSGRSVDIGFVDVFYASLIAALVFPLLFPAIFGYMDVTHFVISKKRPWRLHILQFFVAIQNGFFWHALLFAVQRS